MQGFPSVGIGDLEDLSLRSRCDSYRDDGLVDGKKVLPMGYFLLSLYMVKLC